MKLYETDLRGANLRGAILDESNVKYLEDKYNLDSIYVLSARSSKPIMSYEEYCKTN